MSRLQLLFFAGGFGLVIQSLLPFFHRIDQAHVDWNHEHGESPALRLEAGAIDETPRLDHNCSVRAGCQLVTQVFASPARRMLIWDASGGISGGVGLTANRGITLACLLVWLITPRTA